MVLPHLDQCRVSFEFAAKDTVGKIMRETVALASMSQLVGRIFAQGNAIQFGEGIVKTEFYAYRVSPLCTMSPEF